MVDRTLLCTLSLCLFGVACGDDDTSSDVGVDATLVDAQAMFDSSADGSPAVDSGASDAGPDVSADSGAAMDAGAGDWVAPRGITAPEFGIIEDVDSTCGELSERDFDGLETLEGLAAGTVVTIPGGTHEAGSVVFPGEGTHCQPVIIRGAEGTPPIIHADVEIRGSYIIVEGLDFDLSASSQNRVGFASSDHAVLRHSEVRDLDIARNSTVVFIRDGSHTVIWDNHIHDNGDFDAPGEIDVHGIGARETWDTWILDNHIHHNRGDGMQFGHRAGNNLGRFYVGRNHIHENGENSVDVKEASDVVISENTMHDDTEGPVVLHDCPVNAALIFNEIYNSNYGVSMASLESACDAERPVNLFVLGNNFHDIESTGVQGWGSGKLYFIADNMFRAVGEAISVDPISADSAVSEDGSEFEVGAAAFEATHGVSIR